MGLDTMAYRGLTKIADNFEGDDPGFNFHVEPGILSWIEKRWPGRTAGLEAGALYDYADNIGVLSISYSNYDGWRSSLARRVKHRRGQPGPFAELIEFPDNEGYIGSVVAGKLARDFAEHEDVLLRRASDDFERRYRKLRQGFEMASDNGAVEFH